MAFVAGNFNINKDLLRSVSRSFYLTIRWLPEEMRSAVAEAYLLARATDSVSDTSREQLGRRAEVLRGMERAIAGTADSNERAATLRALSQEMAFAQDKPAERLLLQRFEDCLADLEIFPPIQRHLIRKVLATITEGQLWDISYFTNGCFSVESDEQTKRYIYQVAGSVGEFWTELGLATMGDRFCDPDRAEVMIQAGIRYGQGLQLINILRDRDEDAMRGRSYLCSDSQVWMDRAERYMRDGVDYSRRLRSFRLRFASMLPALIGVKTLTALRNAKPGQAKVKIPRREVYACMLQAFLLSIFPRASSAS